MKRLLIIAGSDPSAGAGVQADLKTASAIGVYGLTVITAVTSQNTKGVQKIHHIPVEHILSQLDSIASDISFDVVKVGMLGNSETADAVHGFLKKAGKPVILDPVIFAQSGGKLSSKNIFEKLFRISDLITPNAAEAEMLTGVKIKDVSDMRKAAVKLMKMTKRVLIKGGDTKIDFDVFGYDGKIQFLPIKRIVTKNTHGTGCSLASAIASYYLNGFGFREAVDKGRLFIRKALLGGLSLGRNFGTVNQFAIVERQRMRYYVLKLLHEAYQQLRGKDIGRFIPEIQSNLVFMLPYSEDLNDIAGFPGRIIRVRKDIHAPFYPEFGASKHIASVVLAANRCFPEIMSAMNIRYSPEIVELMKKKCFRVGSFDRRKEPKVIKEKEGSSLDWGVTEAFRNAKKPFDAVYDEGDVGKEPVIRIFGTDPFDVAKKVLKIAAI
jgi:hydroxymethylpyrimidine kinase/phosphomethylpyrimidine kinase